MSLAKSYRAQSSSAWLDRLPVLHPHGDLPAQLPVQILVLGSACDQRHFRRSVRGRSTCRRYRRALWCRSARPRSAGRRESTRAESLTRPAAILPGQRAIIGIRNPPSYRCALRAAKLDAGLRVLVGVVKTTRMLLVAKVIVTAVVAAEEDDRVVFEFQFVQQVQNFAELGGRPS